MSSRRRWTVLLGLVVSAVFVVLVLRRLDLADVWGEIRQVSLWLLSVSLVTKLVGFLCMSWRAKILFAPLKGFSVDRLFRSILLAFAGNNLLPLRMGELLRVDYLARHGSLSRASTLAVVISERVLDSFCLAVLFLGLLPVLALEIPGVASLYTLGATILAAFLGLWGMSRYPAPFLALGRRLSPLFGRRLSAFLDRKMEAFVGGFAGMARAGSLGGALLATFGYWLASMGSVELWIRAFDLDLPWFAPLVLLAFMAFGTALPSSPGYVGTYEYFTMLALGLFAVDRVSAASFALVGHFVSTVPFTLLALALVFDELRRAARRMRSGDEVASEGTA